MENDNSLQERLYTRLRSNLIYYHISLQQFHHNELIDMAGHISAIAEVFEYLTTKHEYRPGEIETLLDSPNPLDELADSWQVQREDIDDMGFILRGYCAEKEAEAIRAVEQSAPFEKALLDRLDENLASYTERIMALPPVDIFRLSHTISAINDAHHYLTKEYSFEPGDAEYLLRFKNPLNVVATDWQNNRENMEDMADILGYIWHSDYHLERYELAQVSTAPAVEEAPPKPSIREALQKATEQAKQQPGHTTIPKNMEETL